MMQPWKAALAGAVGGAAIAFAVMAAVAASGRLPVSDAQLRHMLAHREAFTAVQERLLALQEEEDNKVYEDSAAAIKKAGTAIFFDPKIAFITGPADAKTTFVEFYDYDCPFCRASLPVVEKYYQAHRNDTRFALIEFPLPTHGESAVLAARASLAARNQPDKYMAMHFALMSAKGATDEQTILDAAAKAGMDMEKLKADMKQPGLEKTLDASKALAKQFGIRWTPAFVINGNAHAGALTEEELTKLLKS
jgi:protein-disulfide isomerase